MENKFQNKVNGAMFTLGKTAFNVVHAPEILVDKAKEHRKEKEWKELVKTYTRVGKQRIRLGLLTEEQYERFLPEILEEERIRIFGK